MENNKTLTIRPPKKDPFWLRFFGKEKTAFKILGLLIALWVAFDTGRVVSNILLLPLAQKTDGSLTIDQMMDKVIHHPGGRLVLLDVGARYQDSEGKTWFVEDIKDDIRPIDYENLIKNNVLIDGSLGFRYSPSSITRTNMVASALTGIAINIVVLVLYGAFGYFIFKTARGAGSRRFNIIDKANVKTTFADVAGHKHAKTELMEVVDFMNNPSKYKRMGGKTPRGVLLYGKPGNGKTLLARAIAGECGVAFIEQSASSFVDKFVGEGASSVRALFKQARKMGPCVIFIDEIDALGASRDTAHEERIQTLNELLQQMDGFNPLDRVLIIGATNRMETLDEGLTREGRLGKHIFIPMPNEKERAEIIEVNLKNIPNHTINANMWAKRTKGFSGATLTGLINNAVFYAVREDAEIVTDAHVAEARDRIVIGLPQVQELNPLISERIAYHELGHAVVSIVLGTPVEKITIEPRGAALGVTVIEEKEEMLLETETDVRKTLSMMMGGRAAEELFLGELTGGAVNDMERASEKARHAVKMMGLGGLAPYIPKHTDFDKNVENHAKAWVFDCYQTALDILTEFKPSVEKLKTILITEKTIAGFVAEEEINHQLTDVLKSKKWLINSNTQKLVKSESEPERKSS
jgi:cell division protease FtsH